MEVGRVLGVGVKERRTWRGKGRDKNEEASPPSWCEAQSQQRDAVGSASLFLSLRKMTCFGELCTHFSSQLSCVSLGLELPMLSLSHLCGNWNHLLSESVSKPHVIYLFVYNANPF